MITNDMKTVTAFIWGCRPVLERRFNLSVAAQIRRLLKELLSYAEWLLVLLTSPVKSQNYWRRNNKQLRRDTKIRQGKARHKKRNKYRCFWGTRSGLLPRYLTVLLTVTGEGGGFNVVQPAYFLLNLRLWTIVWDVSRAFLAEAWNSSLQDLRFNFKMRPFKVVHPVVAREMGDPIFLFHSFY